MSYANLALVAAAWVLLLVGGFFAASDAALSRISRGRAEELLETGRRGASALDKITRDSAPFLAVATFLRVLCETGAVVSITMVCLSWQSRPWLAALISVGVMAVAVFAIVGVGPRTLGRQHTDPIALVSAPMIVWLTRLLGPLARALVTFGNMITPGKGFKDGPFDSEAELRELVDIAEENRLIEAGEREMIHSVFELGDTVVREVMVPRPDLVLINADAKLTSAMSLFIRSGYSRVPVTGDDADDIRGMLYFKDVVRCMHENIVRYRETIVDEVMRSARFVPDSKPVDDLLRQMQRDAEHVAIVIDEYGGTAGMVTLEDLVEEIVGEIADEYDTESELLTPLGEDEYLVSARLHADELGELYDIELDDEEVDTVGGLLAKALGRVPIAGSSAVVKGLRLTAHRFEGRRRRLATVVVAREPLPTQVEEDSAQGEDDAKKADQ